MYPVTIRFWAAARAAVGVETVAIDAESIAEALDRLEADPELRRIIGLSSILVDGRRQSDLDSPLTGPVEAEVLPPFAGG